MLSSKITLSAILSMLGMFQLIAQPTPPPPTKRTPKVVIIQNGDTTIIEQDQMMDLDGLPKRLPNNMLRLFRENDWKELMPLEGAASENKAMLGVISENNEKGALIKEVSKGSAAEKAGIQAEDIITSINGVAIQNAADLSKEVGKHEPDETIQISYLRNGKNETTTATLTKNQRANIRMYRYNRPDNKNFDERIQIFPPNRDMDMDMLPGVRRLQLGVSIQEVESAKGVIITAITENSPAARAGLKKDDIILSANGNPIADVNDVRKLLGNSKEGDKWKIEYERGGKKSSTEVIFPKKLKTADL
ncbi:MAG: PDZ domain-containing protein [Chitinophagia bacterium]|nr:PDZ domain-containing protein [Chitinophagia bacterium]